MSNVNVDWHNQIWSKRNKFRKFIFFKNSSRRSLWNDDHLTTLLKIGCLFTIILVEMFFFWERNFKSHPYYLLFDYQFYTDEKWWQTSQFCSKIHRRKSTTNVKFERQKSRSSFSVEHQRRTSTSNITIKRNYRIQHQRRSSMTIVNVRAESPKVNIEYQCRTSMANVNVIP